MKKTIHILLIMFCVNTIQSQTIELNPQYGYTFRSVYYDGMNRIVFDGGNNYGGSLLLNVNKSVDAGFTFLHQDAMAHAHSYNFDLYGVSVGINHYHLTFLRNFRVVPNDAVTPFTGVDIGASHFYVKSGVTSTLKFSVGAKAGLKIKLSDAVGIRLQAQLNAPISGIGLGFGLGSGGVSVGTTAYASFIQFTTAGTLSFTLGGKKATTPVNN